MTVLKLSIGATFFRALLEGKVTTGYLVKTQNTLNLGQPLLPNRKVGLRPTSITGSLSVISVNQCAWLISSSKDLMAEDDRVKKLPEIHTPNRT